MNQATTSPSVFWFFMFSLFFLGVFGLVGALIVGLLAAAGVVGG